MDDSVSNYKYIRHDKNVKLSQDLWAVTMTSNSRKAFTSTMKKTLSPQTINAVPKVNSTSGGQQLCPQPRCPPGTSSRPRLFFLDSCTCAYQQKCRTFMIRYVLFSFCASIFRTNLGKRKDTINIKMKTWYVSIISRERMPSIPRWGTWNTDKHYISEIVKNVLTSIRSDQCKFTN